MSDHDIKLKEAEARGIRRGLTIAKKNASVQLLNDDIDWTEANKAVENTVRSLLEQK